MQPGGGAADLGAIAEVLAHGGEQRLAPCGVADAGALHVPLEVAVANEVRERQLLEGRGPGIGQRLRRRDRLDERLGQHEVAHAERGEHELRERPDIEGKARAADYLERFMRTFPDYVGELATKASGLRTW